MAFEAQTVIQCQLVPVILPQQFDDTRVTLLLRMSDGPKNHRRLGRGAGLHQLRHEADRVGASVSPLCALYYSHEMSFANIQALSTDTLYRLICSSPVTRVNFSTCVCAMSIRSKGSR